MKNQNLSIDALGRIVSDYGDRSVVDLSVFGRQEVKRFSEVCWDNDHQKFYVAFREGAPERLRDALLSISTYVYALGHEPVTTGPVRVPGAVSGPKGVTHFVCLFGTYAEGVTAEQGVLAYLMGRNEL